MRKLLLASSSPYRKALLERLRLPFDTASPAVDETPLPGESAATLVERLSRLKTEALAKHYASHLIIGSDQVATLDGAILTKPGDYATALAQLTACSGRRVRFYTGLCVYDPSGRQQQFCNVSTDVQFRQLNQQQIHCYIKEEQPYDCAGSFKCEGLGISLFESVVADDPTALVGLPLIKLTEMLARCGADPLSAR